MGPENGEFVMLGIERGLIKSKIKLEGRLGTSLCKVLI